VTGISTGKEAHLKISDFKEMNEREWRKCFPGNLLVREDPIYKDPWNVARLYLIKDNFIFNINVRTFQTCLGTPECHVIKVSKKAGPLREQCGERAQLTQVTGGGTFLRYTQTSFLKHGAEHRYKRSIAFAEIDRCRGS
jgi:hypothetical protein